LDFERNREPKKFLKTLKRKFNLSKIILSGSRAKGNYLKESDYDLIIVSDYFKDIPFLERMKLVYELCDLDINVDILGCIPKLGVSQKLCKFYHTSKRSLKISDN